MISNGHIETSLKTRRTAGGVVAAAFPDAAQAGAAALKAGGNAIDAACAAAWALGVCEPAESGLGGQTTMLIRLSDGRCTVLDGHSRAPAGLTRRVVGRRAQKRGVRATTIPSTPITLYEAQRRFGRLSLGAVLEPAIRLAQEGYRITRLQRRLLRWMVPWWERGSPEAATFFNGDGAPPRAGSLLRQPALAATLERLAREGAQDFYEGRMAREIALDMRERGGLITERDLRGLRLPVERQPLEITYRGRRIISLPPPSGGVQVLLALRVLEGLPGSADDEAQWRLALAEATLATFRERERWPDHPADTTPSIANWLVSPERAERLVKSIRPRAVLPVPGTSLGESGNTTHLCAADQEGNVVSLTQSIQSVFGAKTMHPGLGFFYNNYLSTCPRRPHPYRLGPGCLPQSNAAPTLVLSAEGTPLLALGSAGSRRITSSVVQVISAVLDRGVDLGEALAQPRAHALLNRTVWLEESAPDSVQRAFAERFAPVRLRRPLNYKLGAVQALAWDARGNASGAADPRRDGAVAFA